MESFEYDKINMKYVDLFKMLDNNTFQEKYQNFGICQKGSSYTFKDTEKTFIVFRNKIKVIIKYENDRKNEFNILSTLDINKYCENQKINVNHLYSGRSPYYPNNSAI